MVVVMEEEVKMRERAGVSTTEPNREIGPAESGDLKV